MLKLCSQVLFALIVLFSSQLYAQPCTSSNLAAQASGAAPTACGDCDGSASVTATGGTAPYTYMWSTGDTTTNIGTSQTGASLCINAGGGALNASNGDSFTADQYFSGGTSFSNVIPIANTNDDALFQDERFVGNGGFFSYNIPVTNGNHLVELYFAEIFFGTSPSRPGGVGSRLFDVTIEGVLVLDDYDIFLDAGGPAIAIIKSFNTNVTDGTLNIVFDGVVNNAKINALCVTPVSSTGILCSGTYEVTVTDALGCTATSSVTLTPGACNDNNSCTTDSCITDRCVFTPVVCDDGDACTADSCNGGQCIFTAIPGCGNPCSGIVCDDNDACTTDTCVNGLCSFTAVDCNDNNTCTTDACVNGQCVNTTIPGCGGTCPVLAFSGYAATCPGESAFVVNNSTNIDAAGTIYIDQGSDGTIDLTIPAASFPVGDTQTVAVPAGGVSFTVIAENPGGCRDTFVVNIQSITCNDHDACTTDTCLNGQCSATPISCDDADGCTTDACASGTCLNTPINCTDADPCTADTCSNGVCANTPIPGCSDPCLTLDCDDNDACTADGCTNGICSYTSACDDNDACTTEVCHYNDDDDDDGHHHNGNRYGHHDDDDDDGFHCHRRNIICNDNNKCTTDECVNGVCVFTPKVCDDGDACTDDACHRGNCKFQERRCHDNDACTRDSCGGGICHFIPRNCDDNDLCTVDACVPHNHGPHFWDDYRNNNYGHTDCVHTPIPCDDNNACTTDDCDTAGTCLSTPIANCCLTDAECDDSDLCTTDKCFQTVCRNTASTLKVNEVPNGCQNGLSTLKPSEAGTTYLWSNGATTQTIDGTPGITYTVTVTFANGCVKTASEIASPREELLSSYVLLAEKEIKLYKNTVFDGGVGVTDNHGKLRLKNQTKITAAGTFAQADNIHISGGSRVTDINPTPADVDLPTFEFNNYCNHWNANNVNVQQGQNITLNGSVYGAITANKNSTITFTSADLNIRTLYLKDNVTVNFANCSRVKICKKLRLGEDNAFNPAAVEVILFVEDEVEVESGSIVNADIYLRNGLLDVHSSASNDPTVLTGLFIAERVEAGDNAIWHADPTCDNSCAPTFQQLVVVAPKTSEESAVETVADVITNVADGVQMKSYPNPFTEMLNIEFTVDTDTRAKLEVYSITGQLIVTLFEGNVSAGAVQKLTFAPQTNAEGIYIYRLQTATNSYVGKAIMVR